MTIHRQYSTRTYGNPNTPAGEVGIHHPEPPPPGVDLNRFPGNLTTCGAGNPLPCVPPAPAPTVGGTGVGAKLPLCTSKTSTLSTASTWRENVLPAVSE